MEQGFFIVAGSCLFADPIQKPDHSCGYKIDMCLKAVIVLLNDSELRILIGRCGLFSIAERNEFIREGVNYQDRPVSI